MRKFLYIIPLFVSILTILSDQSYSSEWPSRKGKARVRGYGGFYETLEDDACDTSLLRGRGYRGREHGGKNLKGNISVRTGGSLFGEPPKTLGSKRARNRTKDKGEAEEVSGGVIGEFVTYSSDYLDRHPDGRKPGPVETRDASGGGLDSIPDPMEVEDGRYEPPDSTITSKKRESASGEESAGAGAGRGDGSAIGAGKGEASSREDSAAEAIGRASPKGERE